MVYDAGKVVSRMAVVVGVFAATLCLLYSVYFVRIIRGKPEAFEAQLLQALAAWMIERGDRSRVQIWGVIFLSLLLELTYFILVFAVVQNQFLLVLTSLFAGFEAVHLFWEFSNFHKFFRGNTKLGDVFNWRIERASALFFFTQTLLVILYLLFFH